MDSLDSEESVAFRNNNRLYKETSVGYPHHVKGKKTVIFVQLTMMQDGTGDAYFFYLGSVVISSFFFFVIFEMKNDDRKVPNTLAYIRKRKWLMKEEFSSGNARY